MDKTEKKLSPGAQKLLNRLVNDYSNRMPKEERIFNKKNACAYIYNLYTADYDFSYNQFREIFNHITNS